MASVKFGGGIAAMSGSIGGTTFARNRSGAYARQRTKPVNPNSVGQQLARSIMGQVSAAWYEDLDNDQRTAWTDYANAVTVLNRLGESINLSGYNHFVRSNTARLHAGLDMVLDGPTVHELPAVDSSLAVAVSEATGELSVTFDDEFAWLDETGAALLVSEGAPRPVTRNFFGGPYKVAGAVLGDDETPETSPATVSGAYAVAEDQLVTVQCRILLADGRVSEPFRAECTASA